MDYQSLSMKTVVELRAIAKEMKVRVPAGTKKNVLVELLLEADRTARSAQKAAKPEAPAKTESKAEAPAPAAEKGEPAKPAGRRPRGRKASEAAAEKPVERPKVETKAERPAEAKKPEKPIEVKQAEKPVETSKPEAKAEKPVEAPKPAPKAERPEAKKVEPKPEAPEAPAQPAAKPTEASAPARQEGAHFQPQQAYRAHRPMQGQPRQAQPRTNNGQNRNYNRGEDNRAQARYGNQAGNPAQRYVRNATPTARENAGPQRFNGNPRYEGQPTNPQRQSAPAGAAPTVEAPRAVPEAAAPEQEANRQRYYNAEYKTSNPAVPELIAAGECSDGAGVLEIQQDGYGFLRAENCLPGPNDVYISNAQIRRFNLRMGDRVSGKTRPQREGDRYSAMLYITEVNGEAPEKAAERPRFEDLVPVYPDERLRLDDGKNDLSLRLIDMLAPIGKGQRGMIVSQPKAGKTTLLKKVANAITTQYPDIHLIVLLIDERPEEVTDMKRSINGEVVYSTFDEMPENHARVSEMVLARAQRLVEMGKDVVVLMDSITRLARAYNLVIAPPGRSLSGGLDPGALFKPKRFFGAARNIENGGSLTVIATALVETGSRMDDIIYEEFKGTGNMELHLDRKLSDRRVFPAIDMVRSGTRREELLLTEAEVEGELQVRRMLSGKGPEMAEELINLMAKTANNGEFFQRLKGWMSVYEKEGYK